MNNIINVRKEALSSVNNIRNDEINKAQSHLYKYHTKHLSGQKLLESYS